MGAQPHLEATGPRPGDVVAGKYRVHALLGQGGMGRVWSATNEATGRRVALKLLLDPTPDATARFVREARAAGRIDHPNVVTIYDVVEHEGTPCIVMELLPGESLASVLAREGRLAASEAVAIAVEVARGVEAAHREGIVHRDLKPGNLFLCDRLPPRVKILDFGISKAVESNEAGLTTKSGVVLGTPHYMAPEQVRGHRDVDPRVDVYAIGAVLYSMLVGRPPHEHAHLPALLVEVAIALPTPVDLLRPDLPPALADVVMRTLSKDPAARFASAEALAEALLACGASDGEPPASGAVPPRLSAVPTEAITRDRASELSADTLDASSTSPSVSQVIGSRALEPPGLGAPGLGAQGPATAEPRSSETASHEPRSREVASQAAASPTAASPALPSHEAPSHRSDALVSAVDARPRPARAPARRARTAAIALGVGLVVTVAAATAALDAEPATSHALADASEVEVPVVSSAPPAELGRADDSRGAPAVLPPVPASDEEPADSTSSETVAAGDPARPRPRRRAATPSSGSSEASAPVGTTASTPPSPRAGRLALDDF